MKIIQKLKNGWNPLTPSELLIISTVKNEVAEKGLNANAALQLLSLVPEEKWTINKFTDGRGACCAIGHLERLLNNPNDYSYDNCKEKRSTSTFVRENVRKFLAEKYNITDATLSEVNNHTDINGYNEPVVKDRVIHLLKDMIAAGY